MTVLKASGSSTCFSLASLHTALLLAQYARHDWPARPSPHAVRGLVVSTVQSDAAVEPSVAVDLSGSEQGKQGGSPLSP